MRGLVDRGVTLIVTSHDAAVVAAADHVRAAARWSGGVGRLRHRAGPHDRCRNRARVDGCRKSFVTPAGSQPVLDGVDLAVGPGEVVAIAGRSGSGKTTLLMIIAGWEQPDSGSVVFHRGPTGRRDVAGASWPSCPSRWACSTS